MSQSADTHPTTTADADTFEEEPLRVEMDKRVDLALSIGLILLGAFICYVASGFRVGVFPDPITPRGVPYIMGGFLIIAGIVLSFRRLMTWSALPGVLVPSEGTDDEPGHPASGLRSAGIVILACIWIWLLRPVGYLILSPLVLAGMLWLMQVRSKRIIVLFSLGFPLAVWVIFSLLLKIVIPLGPLMPLARRWGIVP